MNDILYIIFSYWYLSYFGLIIYILYKTIKGEKIL